jgi:hypothetical protein
MDVEKLLCDIIQNGIMGELSKEREGRKIGAAEAAIRIITETVGDHTVKVWVEGDKENVRVRIESKASGGAMFLATARMILKIMQDHDVGKRFVLDTLETLVSTM